MSKNGDKIRLLRVQKGMTQQELANSIGIARQTVSQIENNKITPSKRLLKNFEDFFDKKIDDGIEHSHEDLDILINAIYSLQSRGDITPDGEIISDIAREYLNSVLITQIKDMFKK